MSVDQLDARRKPLCKDVRYEAKVKELEPCKRLIEKANAILGCGFPASGSLSPSRDQLRSVYRHSMA